VSNSETISAVARALRVLEALSGEHELGVSELARRTEQRPSTVHRQLSTLVEGGYVQHNPDAGTYMLGYRLLYLARRVERRDSHLRTVTRPFMRRIQRVCRETTNLVVLDGSEIVYVDQLPGVGAVRMFAVPGRRVAAHATAAGKAMMAWMEQKEVQDLLGTGRLQRFTTSTITNRGTLLAALAEVRQQGYAVDLEEFEAAVTCIASALLDAGGEVVGALSISGPTARLGGPEDRRELGELIGAAAIDASRELGYQGEPGNSLSQTVNEVQSDASLASGELTRRLP
jgi:DNA-binding IclR family transcriptional regulator